MPFCPKCRDEFQDWISVCPDCKVALVPELPDTPVPALRTEPLVHIITAPNEAIASMWAGILEDNGIPCVLKSDNIRAAQYSLLYNQYQRIYVLQSMATEARNLLQPFEQEMDSNLRSNAKCLPIISRIFLVISTAIVLTTQWGGYLLGVVILWISHKIKKEVRNGDNKP